MAPPNAAQKLRRSAQEPEAFASFYDAHSERLLAYLARRVYDPEIALDLMSEVFARAFKARGSFRGSTERQAGAWLYAIARRELARYFRKGRLDLRAVSQLGMELLTLNAEQRTQIDAFAELSDLRGALREALDELSQAHRDALRLRIIDDLSYPEVASRLDISEESARTRVSRGLRLMARALSNEAPTS